MSDYSRIIQRVCLRYDIRVRKWRKAMSGKAWRVYHDDGRVINWIEAPRPKTPLSLGIFLHEVGHHAIGFEKYKRRCEEEFHVWQWALAAMRKLGVEPDERLIRRVDLSMRYAVAKAMRRGIKVLPQTLITYLPQAA
jgi:hypothetical protein